MRRIWRIVLLPALALTLSASATPAGAMPVSTQNTQNAQKRVLVDLRKQGGFAGLDDHMIVYRDGCVRLDRRTGPVIDKCLTGKEERRLRTYLKKLRIGRSETRPPGADFIKYTLAHDRRRASRYTLPAGWQPVVRHLEQIMEKYWAPD
ncbi:hypothetical protein ETD86_14180 [Nonomuraea turkmeniaca]|uniref:Uncharacterized protein n=1 Tax=Nonomuraea turkmeniaca TaxID=103838 RepID=A0A5S4FN95_9ACTN|nr:hypothetical protein [Nonomuraea turkmeniaca]TMR21691.1 hypothetical protein ETD86_14180 [Nonomuraea turkmeniaca]